MKALKLLTEYFENKSKTFIIAFSITLVISVGFADYITGTELEIHLFYLIPISLISWFGGRNSRFIISFLSVLAISTAHFIVTHEYPNNFIELWNLLTRLGFFTVYATVVSFLKVDLDKLNKLNQLLELQATTDSLTGIFNRLKFDEMLINELSRSKRYNIPLSLVMFDIDHFKKINDTFGHYTGDTVLKELTSHISKNIRKHDYFARWGGEEFIILLTHTTLEPAAQFAENCRVQTEQLKLNELDGLTCSFGVTELKADDDIFSFTKRVDKALYKAKNSGRNRVEKL